MDVEDARMDGDGGLGEESTLEAGHPLGGSPEARPAGDLVLEARRAKVFGALFAKPVLRRFGRYVVLDVLGQGGMGVVLKGYDDELDRQVALKMLHQELGEQHTTRLRREAQAMAKLSHPNVVQVYEVGEVEGQTFVAMELVKGKTLREWMQQEPRPRWTACVELFVQVGSGLAAAHERGLVHRDFKPGNAIVDDKGRARVLDFGLARLGDEEAGEVSSRIERARTEAQQVVPLETSLTKTGAVLGTPAYMPPEQMDGHEADARSDQFSFCVALYEAVYGERPYEGSSMMALMVSMRAGAVRPVPKGSDVPAVLRKVLLRGLAVDREQRWPSMEALLEALRRVVAPRGRRFVVASLAVAAVGLGGSWAFGQYVQTKDRCTGAEGRLEGIWDDARRQEVQAAILGTTLSYAPGTWERVEPRLDEYADAWASKHGEVCEATSVRNEQSAEVMDLRMGCLEKRRGELKAAVGVLAEADATVVENAVELVAGLPGFERCDDVDALRAEVPPPEDPEVAEKVAALDERLVEAKAQEGAGKYEEGLRLADEVVEQGRALEYEPLMARAWLRQGDLRRDMGDYEGAVEVLHWAYGAAVAHSMEVEAADASGRLVFVLGYKLARHEEARGWAEHAEALSRAAGTDQARAGYLNALAAFALSQGEYEQARTLDERALAIREKALGPEHPDVAASLNHLAAVVDSQGEYEQARTLHERALAIGEKALGPEHPDVAASLENLANVAESQGEYEQARTLHERALAIKEKALGPEHPDVAASLNNLAIVAYSQGEYEQARTLHERALAIREKALGPEHPRVAQSLNNLANVARSQGEYEQARTLNERALAIREKALGPEHPDVAQSLNNLANVARSQGEYEQARTLNERALAILEKALGPEHPHVAQSLNNLATVAQSQGEYEQARTLYERALAIWEKALGPEHPHVAYPLTGIGETLLALDKPAEALAPLERALTIRTTHNVDPALLAETRFTLARALWTAPIPAGRDRPRARTLAEQAREAYASLGDAQTKELAEVDAWLAKHPLP